MSAANTWAVVTPVYEDKESFALLCRDLAAQATDVPLEVIAVDDGSIRHPPDVVSISNAGLAGSVIRLRRNVGHQAAIAIGIVHVASTGGYAGAVVMDSDGEDCPEHVPDLVRATESEGVDLAVASRRRRSETISFRIFYRIYLLFFQLLTGQVIRFGNFMALPAPALDRLAAMQETWTHVAGAVVKTKLRRGDVSLDRGTRYAGRSKMNFYSLVLHGIRAVTVFGDAVLTRMAVVCAWSAIGCIAVFLIAASLKLVGQATPGWLTTVTGFMILIFMQAGVLTLVTLIMNGLGFRAPGTLMEDAKSLIRSVDRTTGDGDG